MSIITQDVDIFKMSIITEFSDFSNLLGNFNFLS